MSTNILKDMKQALINAHNNNNAKAISKDFAEGSGVSERSYTSWVTWCDTLHYKLSPWAEKYNNGEIPDAELNKFLDEAMPILKQMAKVDAKLFIRTNDATFLVGKVHDFGKSANGTLDVVKGKVAFRRQIEAMLGNRIAAADAVSEDDYDIIIKYEKAEKNIAKANDRLNGYVNPKGEKIVGLKEKLEEAEKKADSIKKSIITTYAKFNAVPTDKDLKEDEGMALAMANVEALKDTIKSTEGQISKAKETKKKTEKKYKELMAAHPEIKTK